MTLRHVVSKFMYLWSEPLRSDVAAGWTVASPGARQIKEVMRYQSVPEEISARLTGINHRSKFECTRFSSSIIYLKQQWDGSTLWEASFHLPPPDIKTPNMLLALTGGNAIRYSLPKLTKFVIYYVEGPYASLTTDSIFVDTLSDKDKLLQ